MQIKGATTGKPPVELDKTKSYLFWVHPEGHQSDTYAEPFPLLVCWVWGDVKNWKVYCTFERDIDTEIGADYTLVCYAELPDNQTIFKHVFNN